jgi:hypothetical protein
MKEYIIALIGAAAIIIAAIIGLFARKSSKNKQIVKKSDNSIIYQANGSITIGDKEDKKQANN